MFRWRKRSGAMDDTRRRSSSEDRRESPRVALVDQYLYYLKDPLRDSSAIRAEVVDISRTGVLFRTSESFTIGQEVTLKIGIPFRNESIRTAGKVVRMTPSQDGQPGSVAVRYTKILGGPRELLFETLLDLLCEEN
jgi:Tfp pilus assembly protein PilZ